MPAKKITITDAERAKRIREIAREIATDNDPKSLEMAFKKIVAQHNRRLQKARRRPMLDLKGRAE